VLTSVHAFASDPERGLFILLFLLLVVGGSLLLFAIRAPRLSTSTPFELISRESGLLFNNALLSVACASVLLGTLYPLAVDGLGLGKVSVGAPWFNAVFVPLMVPLVAAVGVGALLNWKRDKLQAHRTALIILVVGSLITGTVLTFMQPYFSIAALLALALAVWVVGTTIYGLVYRIRNKRNKLSALTHTPMAFWGMTIAHLGIAVFTVGVALVSVYNTEADIRMEIGDTHVIEDFEFTLDGVASVRGPNYQAAEGAISVTEKGKELVVLKPQKRVYNVRRESMTEASIHGTVTRDLFAALGDPLDKTRWCLECQALSQTLCTLDMDRFGVYGTWRTAGSA